MIKIKAKIKLFEGPSKRQTPFFTGYRPLFKFTDQMKTSGQITLINQGEFRPGDEGIVEITFLHGKYLGRDFGLRKFFKFYEGEEPLGEGEVIELL